MKPVLQALVLAEKIYEDKSGKKVIAGTFNRIRIHKHNPAFVKDVKGTELPLVIAGGQPPSPWAYISLTDVCNNTKMVLQVVCISKNKILYVFPFKIERSDRLQTIELVVPLPAMNFTQEGLYALEILCEGEILGSHRITVTKADQ